MRRYLLTSLLIGSAVTLVILILYWIGVFTPMVTWLATFYASIGFFDSLEVERVRWLEIPMIVISAVGVAWCVIDVSRLAKKILIAVSVAAVVFGMSPTFAFYNMVFDPFSSLAAVILSAVAALAYAGTEKGMRKKLLEDVLGMRVSSKTFHDLLEAPEDPHFQGVSREVSVLTCRFFNHEELQASLEPAELVKMSNLFIRSSAMFLMSKGAYLDESSPEMVRVSFGMLHAMDDHAEHACLAALELRSRLRNLSQECETRWFQPLRCGVGISTGTMTVGIYGSPDHFYFSGIGTETDYSRRLAHVNLRYGSSLLIGPKTYHLVREKFEVRPMEMYYDPAANVMTEVYELLAKSGNFPQEDAARRDFFWQGMIYLREKNYEAALDYFSRSRQPGADDKTVAYFIGKCQEGVADPEAPVSRRRRELAEEGHARLISLM